MQDTRAQVLRQRFRQRRRQLTREEQRHASTAVLEQCLNQPEFNQAHTIACYLAEDGELDPAPIVEYCWQQGKQVCLPVLHPFCSGYLLFVRYGADSMMQRNRFNIPEPALECAHIVPLTKLDIIFTPLVAFDAQGNRLGMGGGFYDRTLAPLYQPELTPQPSETSVIGLAHDCQQADALVTQPWDLPMQKIITPSTTYITTQKD